jgi:hypothetical protein
MNVGRCGHKIFAEHTSMYRELSELWSRNATDAPPCDLTTLRSIASATFFAASSSTPCRYLCVWNRTDEQCTCRHRGEYVYCSGRLLDRPVWTAKDYSVNGTAYIRIATDLSYWCRTSKFVWHARGLPLVSHAVLLQWLSHGCRTQDGCHGCRMGVARRMFTMVLAWVSHAGGVAVGEKATRQRWGRGFGRRVPDVKVPA